MSDVKNPYRTVDGKPQLLPSVAAFVDILGYQECIDAAFKQGKGQEELERLRNALDAAHQHVKEEPAMFAKDKLRLKVRSFTDNLVIGFPISEHGGSLPEVMTVVSLVGYFQAELARLGYFIRGGISVGDLYIDEDIVFGPALMDAYRHEAKAAHPRVILSSSAEKAYRAGNFSSGEHTAPELLIDSDNQVFIDYLDNTVMIAYPDDRPFTEFLDGHKSHVIAKLSEFATIPKVRAKYEWAANYHNAFCDRYPDLFNFEDKVPQVLLVSPPKPWKISFP